MKSLTLTFCFSLLLAAANAAPPEPPNPPSPEATPAASPSEKTVESIRQKIAPLSELWNIRVEALMVALPQEKALVILPDLRSPEKIEAAFAQLLAAIEKKEAVLLGYPVVYVANGERAVAEDIEEKRYPTEFEIPENSYQRFAAPPNVPAVISDVPAVPTSFETRNIGVTLEAAARVIPPEDWISLEIVPQRTVLLGFDSYDAAKTTNGKVVKLDQPRFGNNKVTSSLYVRNGERRLVAVHRLNQPENHLELVILQATATPLK